MTPRRGSEHGPVAATLHNRILARAGMKNPGFGNILPRHAGPRNETDLAASGAGQPRGRPAWTVTRFISAACRASSQLISAVADIASTSEAETPIRFR